MNLSDLQELQDNRAAVQALDERLDAHPADYPARLEQAALLVDQAELLGATPAALEARQLAALQRLLVRHLAAPRQDSLRGEWWWWGLPPTEHAIVQDAFRGKVGSWGPGWPRRWLAETALLNAMQSAPVERLGEIGQLREWSLRAEFAYEAGDRRTSTALRRLVHDAPAVRFRSYPDRQGRYYYEWVTSAAVQRLPEAAAEVAIQVDEYTVDRGPVVLFTYYAHACRALERAYVLAYAQEVRP